METKEGLKINKYGQSILDTNGLMRLILEGKNINNLNVIIDDDIIKFNKFQADLLDKQVSLFEQPSEDLSIEDFHKKSSSEWLIPDEYKKINVLEWLLTKCKTEEQRNRVELEYRMYEERDLIMALKLFIFIVDYMRKNRFIWGVGRGSSVSSYILYLIGIHRVDSLYYDLDIKEYLK